MGDVQDQRPLLLELTHQGEQAVQLLLRQDSRGLVQDQDPRPHRDCLGDLDHLLVGDAQVTDDLTDVDADKADRGQDLVSPAVGLGPVHASRHSGGRHLPQQDILGHRQVGHQAEFLVDRPIPNRFAASGVLALAGTPSSRISPASRRMAPDRTFIRVDLPAPFSPTIAWTSRVRRRSRRRTAPACRRSSCRYHACSAWHVPGDACGHAGGKALWTTIVFWSVISCSVSWTPSRPWPLSLIPPNGRVSIRSADDQLTITPPASRR